MTTLKQDRDNNYIKMSKEKAQLYYKIVRIHTQTPRKQRVFKTIKMVAVKAAHGKNLVNQGLCQQLKVRFLFQSRMNMIQIMI